MALVWVGVYREVGFLVVKRKFLHSASYCLPSYLSSGKLIFRCRNKTVIDIVGTPSHKHSPYQHLTSTTKPLIAMDAFFDADISSSISGIAPEGHESPKSPSEYGVPVNMEEANKNSNTYCVIA